MSITAQHGPEKRLSLTADQHDNQKLSSEVVKQVKLTVLRLTEQHIPEDAVYHADSADTTDHNQTACSARCREEHPTAVADYGSVPIGVAELVISKVLLILRALDPQDMRHEAHLLRPPANVAGVQKV